MFETVEVPRCSLPDELPLASRIIRFRHTDSSTQISLYTPLKGYDPERPYMGRMYPGGRPSIWLHGGDSGAAQIRDEFGTWIRCSESQLLAAGWSSDDIWRDRTYLSQMWSRGKRQIVDVASGETQWGHLFYPLSRQEVEQYVGYCPICGPHGTAKDTSIDILTRGPANRLTNGSAYVRMPPATTRPPRLDENGSLLDDIDQQRYVFITGEEKSNSRLFRAIVNQQKLISWRRHGRYHYGVLAETMKTIFSERPGFVLSPSGLRLSALTMLNFAYAGYPDGPLPTFIHARARTAGMVRQWAREADRPESEARLGLHSQWADQLAQYVICLDSRSDLAVAIQACAEHSVYQGEYRGHYF